MYFNIYCQQIYILKFKSMCINFCISDSMKMTTKNAKNKFDWSPICG